jgi:hypothetical protein
MPFQDDTGVSDEQKRGPLWGVFALFAGQVERMVALNLAWSLNLLPMVIAFAAGDLPLPLRLVLLLYTAVMLPPATATLFGVVRQVLRYENINPALVREQWALMWLAGYRTLMPLYSLLGLLGFMALTTQGGAGVLVQLALWFVLVAANYWGPLLAVQPEAQPWAIAADSLRLLWRYPAQTLLVSAAVALVLLIGSISIGGLFLAVPVLIALLQTAMYEHLRGHLLL